MKIYTTRNTLIIQPPWLRLFSVGNRLQGQCLLAEVCGWHCQNQHLWVSEKKKVLRGIWVLSWDAVLPKASVSPTRSSRAGMASHLCHCKARVLALVPLYPPVIGCRLPQGGETLNVVTLQLGTVFRKWLIRELSGISIPKHFEIEPIQESGLVGITGCAPKYPLYIHPFVFFHQRK